MVSSKSSLVQKMSETLNRTINYIKKQDVCESPFSHQKKEADNSVVLKETERNRNNYIEEAIKHIGSCKKELKGASDIMADMQFLQEQLAKKGRELGRVFEKISDSYATLEGLAVSRALKVDPKLSTLYQGFKKTLFNWSNQLTHSRNQLSRFVEPCVYQINDLNDSMLSELKTRDRTIQGYLAAVKNYRTQDSDILKEKVDILYYQQQQQQQLLFFLINF